MSLLAEGLTAHQLHRIRTGGPNDPAAREAFAALMARKQPLLEGWLNRRMGAFRTGLYAAEDIAQSVMFKLWGELSANRTWVANVTTGDDLRHILFRLLTLRVADAIDWETRPKRAGTVQDPLLPDGNSLSAMWADTRPDTDPAERATAAEAEARWEDTLREVRELVGREVDDGIRVFEDYLADVPVAESAAKLDAGERSIQRRRASIRELLAARFQDALRYLLRDRKSAPVSGGVA